MAREFSVIINKPIEEVFGYSCDVMNLSDWGEGIINVDITSDVKEGVGTRFVITNNAMGREQQFINEITEYEENERFSFRAEGSYTSTRTFKEVDGGVLVTERLEGAATGIKRLMSGIIVRFASKMHHNSLTELKRILESEE
ncbi:MAG: SRPBCC family protein [Candidatus Kariarchaeaceae archaeon]|jgi:uncharacterized protein YndB with AHSA1/START domain